MVLAREEIETLRNLTDALEAERRIDDVEDVPARTALIRRSARLFGDVLAVLAEDAAHALDDEDASALRAGADQARDLLRDLAGDLNGPLIAAWRRERRAL